MKKTKKAIIAFLCVVALSMNTAIRAYAVNNSNGEKSQSKNEVYLTEGQGNENIGDGSKNNPYRNIKTAINNVEVGGTIKIINTVNYWKYEEAPDKTHRPLIIDKNVIFQGINSNSVFAIRAPIQLGANVTFKDLNMQFWASNELMPGVPDSGYPQDSVDEWTTFRSGRSIYLAGNELTLDNIDTRIYTVSFQKDYRPFISGGTFKDEDTTGTKAVLNIKNPNSETKFAGIYAGDYWTERSYPVELNIAGEVLDYTIHTGGIMKSHKGDVVVNIHKKAHTSVINTKNHNGNVDLNIKEGASLLNVDFTGVRNLTLENNAEITFKDINEFSVNNLILKRDALLDLRKINGNITVKDTFIGDIDNTSNNGILGGVVFLNGDQVLDISGDVQGTTRLNSYSAINKVPLKENHTYIKAQENASGNFVIDPEYSQSNYKLLKNTNNSRTTWTAIKDNEKFKELRWSGSENDKIISPEENKDYLYPIEFINEKDEIYIPFGEDWSDFTTTLTKPDGTILDNNNNWDMDLGVYLEEPGVVINIYNINFSGELTLTVTHKSGKSITKKIQVGETTKPPVTMVDLANVADKYNTKKGQAGYDEKHDKNNDGIIDIYDIVMVAKEIEN